MPSYGQLTTLAASASPSATLPLNFAAVLFPAFEPLDVLGPLDPLQIVSNHHQMNLHLLSHSMDPVTSATQMNPFNSSWPLTINPTMTFDDALASNLDIDVLLVPGGPGARAPIETLQPSIDFIKTIYPNLQYLITVCTGASLAARAGVLDRRRATTNKRAWTFVTAFGPDVEWVSPARFVVDGNIWSSSGVSALLFFLSPSSLGLMDFKTNPHSTADDGTKTNQVTAGLDLIWAWIEEVYGADLAYEISGMTEYEPHPPTYDPFAERFNVPPSP
ncbi:hypothetical protein jhhlp_004322 [Lomentospora prolificans]|uniref:DJ-1/PfpI domain-containing protein n=1 Tax=Lomentospora prolificans TaxID=41688 RepID=A0A2N3NBB2_9PEZI|nr:hypothetical protein jhhlp_004322 [Lomentospora prolificans]